MIDPKIWNDQAEFNRQVHPEPAADHAALAARTKEFTLHQMTEMAEFLEAGQVWGQHRRRVRPFLNRENVKRQLIDQFKYWMILAQEWGFTLEELEHTYWAKSATVRQRFTEEWLIDLDRPVAIFDLDGVLCDWIFGFTRWAAINLTALVHSSEIARIVGVRLAEIRANQSIITAESLGVSVPLWNEIQHHFRVSGETAHLPVMPDAMELLTWCRDQGYCVAVLTSRPIDEYPNLYDETVRWFEHELKFKVDRIWWGANKAEKLAAIPNIPEVVFAVEDDPKFVKQFRQAGVKKVYWMKTAAFADERIHGSTLVWSLGMVQKEEMAK